MEVCLKHIIRGRPFPNECYYIGATCRSPWKRWRLETVIPHYRAYKRMLVVFQGTGIEGCLVEPALIDQFLNVRRDRLVQNVAQGGGGISREADRCYVYVCVGGGPPTGPSMLGAEYWNMGWPRGALRNSIGGGLIRRT